MGNWMVSEIKSLFILYKSTSLRRTVSSKTLAEMRGDSRRETNLKCRQCLPETAEMMDNHELIGQFDGEIVCELPNNLLNKFDGTLTWKGHK